MREGKSKQNATQCDRAADEQGSEQDINVDAILFGSPPNVAVEVALEVKGRQKVEARHRPARAFNNREELRTGEVGIKFGKEGAVELRPFRLCPDFLGSAHDGGTQARNFVV